MNEIIKVVPTQIAQAEVQIENGRPEVLVYESWKMVGDALYAGVTMYEANNSGNVNWKK